MYLSRDKIIVEITDYMKIYNNLIGNQEFATGVECSNPRES